MINSLLPGLFCLFLGALSTSHSQAAVVLYTDRAAWEAAAGGGTGNIVDNMDSGTYSAAALNRGSYVITGDAYGFFPNGNPVNAIDGTGYLRLFLDANNDTTFTFNDPITAFGFDVHPDSTNLTGPTVLVSIDGSAAVTSYSLPTTNVNGFRGFISDTSLTSFALTSAGDALHGIDNFEAFSAVPEPSRTLLLLLGGAGCMLRRRRCRAPSAHP